MDKTVKTKRLFREAKVGDVVGVILGMELKTAVKITRIWIDEDGHKVATGMPVNRKGFSNRTMFQVNTPVSFYL